DEAIHLKSELGQLKMQIKSNDQSAIIAEIDKLKQDIQLKNTQIIEKDTRLKQLERDSKQELLKCRADIEIIKKEFNDKEKQLLCNHDKLVKLLEEKNVKLTEDYQRLSQKINSQHKEEETKVDKNDQYSMSLSPTFDLDLFRSSKLLKTFGAYGDRVYSIDYSTFGSGRYLCSGSGDQTIRVWNIETNKQIQLFKKHSGSVICVKFSPYHYHNHRQNVICSSSADKTIRLWNVEDNQQLQTFNEHTDGVCGIEFSPFNGGRYLCSGSGDFTIRLWDVETSKLLHVFDGHKNVVWCVDFLPLQSNNNNKSNSIGVIGGNGYTFCSGSWDKTIRIWDIEKSKQLIVFKGHEDSVDSIKYGPKGSKTNGDANLILSGSSDKSVRLWDVRSGQQMQVFNGHTDCVNAVEYSPFVVNNNEIGGSSNVICSGSRDSTIRFWDIRSTNEKVMSLKFLSLKKKENESCVFNLCYGSTMVTFIFWDSTTLKKKKN
ncbi:WD repeat-containing protein, partial [Reticulomyxa filosa]